MSYLDDLLHYMASPYTSSAPQTDYSQPVSSQAGNPTLAYIDPTASGNSNQWMNQGLTNLANTPQPPPRPTNLAGSGLQAYTQAAANGAAPLPPSRPQSFSQPAPSANQLLGQGYYNSKQHGLINNILHTFGVQGTNPLASLFTGGSQGNQMQANAAPSTGNQNPLQGLGDSLNGLGQGISNGLTGIFSGLFG